jgi:hypothetical protein
MENTVSATETTWARRIYGFSSNAGKYVALKKFSCFFLALLTGLSLFFNIKGKNGQFKQLEST